MKRSTSELFVANCDEFIFYDDLVRKKAPRKSKQPQKKAAKADAGAQKKDEAVDLVLETLETILENKGGDDLVWGSMIKQAIKRRKPGFNESYFGFRGFNSLLEEARERGLLELQPDEKSGGYLVKAVEKARVTEVPEKCDDLAVLDEICRFNILPAICVKY